MAHAVLPRKYVTLLFLESAAAAHLLLGLSQAPTAAQYAATNVAPRAFRLASTIVPWAFALGCLLGCGLLLRRKPAHAALVQRYVTALRPLLVAWAAPWLLARTPLAERPLVLLGLSALLTIGFEWSLRRHEAWPWTHRLASAAPAGFSGRLAPRLLAFAMIAAVTAFFYFGAVRVHEKMLSSNYDFGLFENLFWNTLHGRHGIALERRYFVDHAEFLLYALLPFYALVPRSETLYALQALLMAGAAVPLFLLAERWLASGWAALCFVFAYLCHPALHGPAFYDFHFLPLSAFFLLWAAYFFARKPGGVAFWVAIVLALCCREDVALGVGIVGAGLWWTGRNRSTAAALFGLGLLWFLLCKFVWMPRHGGASFTAYYSDLIPSGERGFGAVLTTLLSNPLFAAGSLLSQEKLLLGLQLLVPLAFLPVRYARVLFLLGPGLVVVGLVNSGSPIVRVHFHYSTHFLPYLFVAAIAALAVKSRRRRGAPLAALLLGSAVVSSHFGAFFAERFKTSFHEVSFDWTESDERTRAARLALVAQIPAAASVSAAEYEGPHVARRARLFALKAGSSGADYVLYSRRSLRWGGADELGRILRSGEYGVLDARGDLTLLRRNHDTARNAEALRALR